jgi:hypothetical protein
MDRKINDYQINIHKVTPTEKNPFKWAVVYGDGLMRWLLHRKCEVSPRKYRDMIDEERMMHEKTYRYIMYKYRSLHDLIEDEWLSTHDMKWMEELKTLDPYEKIDLNQIIQKADLKATQLTLI